MMYLGNQAVGLTTSLPVFADIAKVECGEYIHETDIAVTNASVAHSLGEIPDFIMFFADNIPISANYENKYVVCGFCVNMDAPVVGNRYIIYTNIAKNTLGAHNAAYKPSEYATSINFIFPYKDGTEYLKGNTKYFYTIGKFKEVTSNA